MADRRKANQNLPEIIQETDKQFMEKNNVYEMMKDLLAQIIANRPDDPIKFIANYFENMSSADQSTDLINRAVVVLFLTHHSRPMFESNVQSAFDLFSKYRINKKLQGINGSVLSVLLHALCNLFNRVGINLFPFEAGTSFSVALQEVKNIPSVVTIRLLKRLECLEHEVVTYSIFRSAVFTCCVLNDYVAVAGNLFQTLDVQKSGKADKNLCEIVLEQLKVALSGSQTDVKRILESSYSLSPDGLYRALDKAMTRKVVQGFCTREQFVTEACDSFLAKVNRLR